MLSPAVLISLSMYIRTLTQLSLLITPRVRGQWLVPALDMLNHQTDSNAEWEWVPAEEGKLGVGNFEAKLTKAVKSGAVPRTAEAAKRRYARRTGRTSAC